MTISQCFQASLACLLDEKDPFFSVLYIPLYAARRRPTFYCIYIAREKIHARHHTTGDGVFGLVMIGCYYTAYEQLNCATRCRACSKDRGLAQ